MAARFRLVFIFFSSYSLLGFSQNTQMPEDSKAHCSVCNNLMIDRRLLLGQPIKIVKCYYRQDSTETTCSYILGNGDSIVGLISSGMKEGVWFLFKSNDPWKTWKKSIVYSSDTVISFHKNNRRRKKVEYRTHFYHQ
jgi:hypothetical protein